MLISIFAPEPVSRRGVVTPDYLNARWLSCLDQLCGNRIEMPLGDLAAEFDISNVGWEELGPYYHTVHEYQKRQRSEIEITMLGMGYANILMALRLSSETYGERPTNEIEDILTEYLNTFTRLRNVFFKTSNFTNSLAKLVEKDASIVEIRICCYFAEYIARGDIDPDEIESIYLTTDWSDGTPDDKEETLVNRIKEVVQRNREKREFLGEVDEVRTFDPNEGERNGRNHLFLFIDAAITLAKLIFR